MKSNTQAPSNNPWAAHMQASSSRPSPSYPSPHQYQQSGQLYPVQPQFQQQSYDPPPPYGEVFPDQNSTRNLQPPSDSKQSRGADVYRSPADSSLSRERSPSSASDDEILQQALEFTHHAPPAYRSQQALRRPIVVPQINSGTGMPFTRAYAPILAEHGVSMEEFVEFVDNLNVVSASSPPLQVLDLAGGIVGFVPLQTAQLVGIGIQAIAKLGNVAVMKTRGSKFMKKANSDFFNPRGLKVELATSDAVKARVGLNPSASLTAPIGQSGGLSSVERKMAGLSGFVEPLTFNVPPPNAPTNKLDQLSAKQQAMKLRKQDKKVDKDRAKYFKKGDEINSEMSKKARELERELQKLDLEREKEERKRDKELRNVYDKEREESKRRDEEAKVEKDFEKETRKLDKEYQKLHEKYDEEVRKGEEDKSKEDKEGEKAQKIQWILVESL